MANDDTNNNIPPIIDESGVVKVWNFKQNSDGSLTPASSSGVASAVDISDSSGNPLNSNGSGALNVAVVSGGGSNASVGTNGSAAPSSSTQVGGSDGTNLQPLQVDASKNLKTIVNAALPAGTNVIGHVIADSGSTTAVIQPTAANLNATVVGTVTADIVGHAGAVLDGTAGTPSVGVLTVQGVSGGTTMPVTAGIANSSNNALAAWTSSTTISTTAAVLTNDGEWNSVTITLNQTATITAGAITFQVSEDGTNWINALPVPNPAATLNGTYTFVPSTYVAFQFNLSGFKYFQVVLSTAIVGSGTVTIGYELHAGALPSRTKVSLSKLTTIETTTLLTANSVFTGPWHDTSADGTVYVVASAFSNVTAANNGFVLQETDDPTNANLTHTVVSSGANSANSLDRIWGVIRNRYWRIVYTNGGSNQTGTFELTTTASNSPILVNDTGVNGLTSQFFTPPICLPTNSNSGQPADNTGGSVSFTGPNATTAPLNAGSWMYGGAFSGTASAAKSGWSKARTPTVFNTAQATLLGNTAVWTPAPGNKFRLLKLLVQVTNNASLASGGVLTINFQDATTSINISFDVFVPTTAVTTTIGDGLEQELDLGQFGILSAAANNALNVNLSVALATGNVRVIAMGTEE